GCEQRFTFTKRRHHCRACGKVYCTPCCNQKCKLKYLGKEARVCVFCYILINKAQNDDRSMSPTGPSPNPNVPSEYCSTIPPLQQAQAAGTLNSPPPTVMVPVSVLKQPNNDACPREQKRVWFADGILPNGEVADTTKLSSRNSQEFSSDPETPGSSGSDPGVCSSSAPDASGAVEMVRPPVSGPWDYRLLSGLGSAVKRIPSLLPDSEDELPPLLISTEEDGGDDVLVEESPAPCQILHLLEEGGPRPLTFVLNANLLVNVKLVTYSNRQCWCLGSIGLQALGQKELVFLLECLPGEKTLPRDLFSLYLSIYQDAQKGKFVEELDNVTFTTSFLGSKDHAGMLFFPPTCQSLDGLALPPQSFLFGLLIQKLEVPWAKVFPLRLLLRLGSEYDVYPTTLLSVRFRNSVYRETGHTIMNLLADLRNYQYSLPVVEGLRIHMEMGHIYIDIPKSSFNEMQKVVNSSNEHVISIGASFSQQADSHLVCLQNEEGNYQTQANSMPEMTRTVTGASFVVFNGALKASSGFIAKSSIVEDGLMVQIPPETMESLRSALREKTDFHIPCGKNDGGEVRENVTIRWVDWTSPINSGRTSGVDGRPLDGVHSVKMQQDAEFKSDGRTIRCTEVFYQLKSPDCSLASVLSSCSVFQKEIALATCSALTPHLSVLTCSGINSLSLRISTQADMVEYQAGSGGRLLPQHYMNEMDGALIPVIHGGSASVPQTTMDMEFIFYITHVI
ncbi:zinc finger FYVE domain-containing protein 9, partial [Nematolebias whitei]|uniref:zinc finger FYVE domain-containing protein 9 n=1 Tax=Nematolebias whitei TaxID=451745 RepID=UPI001898E57B